MDMTERTERLDMDGAPYQMVFSPGKLTLKDDQDNEVGSFDTPYQGSDLEGVKVEQVMTTEAMVSTEGGPMYRIHKEGDAWQFDAVEDHSGTQADQAESQEPSDVERDPTRQQTMGATVPFVAPEEPTGDGPDRPVDKPEDMPEAL